MGTPCMLPGCLQHIFEPSGEEVALGVAVPIDDPTKSLQRCLQVPQAK